MLEEEEKAAAEATGKRKTKTKRGRGRGSKKKTKTTNKFPNDPDAEGYEVSIKCVRVPCISWGYH